MDLNVSTRKWEKKCVCPSGELFWTIHAHQYDLMNNNQSAFRAAKISSYCSDSFTLSWVHIDDFLS